MADYTIDVDMIFGQHVIAVDVKASVRKGIVGGAILNELRALVNGAGSTAVSIPVGLYWELENRQSIAVLDAAKRYTTIVADPDVSSGPWSTLQAIATALQL